jgi:hypothetical protein
MSSCSIVTDNTGSGPNLLNQYVLSVDALGVAPGLNERALTTVLEFSAMGASYRGDDSSGRLPSSVYLITSLPSDDSISTFASPV